MRQNSRSDPSKSSPAVVLTEPQPPPPVLIRSPTGGSSHASFKTALEGIFQEEVSGSDLSVVLELEGVTKQASPGRCLLVEMLPPELHYEILSHLTYWDHRQLKNTSHFFRDYYITEQYYEKSRQNWSKTLLEREIDDKLGTQTRLPCYRCLRLRRKSLFPSLTISMSQNSTATTTTVVPGRMAERVCTDCLWIGAARGKPVVIRGCQWTKCFICGRRKKIHAYEDSRRAYFCTFCGFLLADRRDIFFILAEFVFPCVLVAWLGLDSARGLLPAASRSRILGSVISAFLLQMIKFYYVCRTSVKKKTSYSDTLLDDFFTYVWSAIAWTSTISAAPPGMFNNPEFAGIRTLSNLFLSCALVNLFMLPLYLIFVVTFKLIKRKF